MLGAEVKMPNDWDTGEVTFKGWLDVVAGMTLFFLASLGAWYVSDAFGLGMIGVYLFWIAGVAYLLVPVFLRAKLETRKQKKRARRQD